MMPSLRYRLVLIVGTTVCLLLIVCGFVVSTIFELSLRAELDSSLTERARSLSHLVEHEEHGFTFEWLEGAGATAPIDQERESFTIWNESKLLEVFPPKASPIEPRKSW